VNIIIVNITLILCQYYSDKLEKYAIDGQQISQNYTIKIYAKTETDADHTDNQCLQILIILNIFS